MKKPETATDSAPMEACLKLNNYQSTEGKGDISTQCHELHGFFGITEWCHAAAQ